jgi:enhancer of polycomb-like protein
MDERDQEWLDKNNEEARGEGTSAQGSSRSRAGRSKGKEAEAASTLSMTEDEFELVMGLFEKITHDKTEHLHLSLETGMAFPSFSPDYEDVFSRDLPPSVFAAFAVPAWIPTPAHLVKLARAVYPHWKDRRVDREGHRITPAVNVSMSSSLD